MSQPTPYTRQFGFTDYSASYPDTQQPGAALDAEFSAAKVTLDATLRNLALIQRDDGALKNNLVTLDSLTPEVMLALGAGVIWLPRGNWVFGTLYAVSDVIKNGTASYVCAVAHTAGVFTTDFAAGKWVLLFDSNGTTPADGSVTPAKLAPLSVTTPAIGFTGLDLSGSIRAATGLQAGTAPLGSLLHAKAATGDAIGKIERTTDAQGSVGYRISGVAYSWTFAMPVSSSSLTLSNSVIGTTTVFSPAGGLDQSGHVRATGSAVPPAGAGAALSYLSSVGYLTSYDYDAAAWRDLKVRGLAVYLSGGAVDVVKVTSTGLDVIAGYARRGGLDLGYLDLPANAQSTAYVLALTDRGKEIYSQNLAGQTVTIPAAASVAFPAGSIIAIRNDGTNPITIDASAVTLKISGSGGTGNRTIAVNGRAILTLSPVANRWWIDGVGVS